MHFWPYLIFPVAGLAGGYAIWYFFRKMPAAWLLDYGETEIPPELKELQLLPFLPDALLLMAADALVFLLGWIFLGLSWELAAVLMAAQPLLLVMAADIKTRIIPDQFILALLPCALLLWVADGLNGSPAWLSGLLQRILAGLAGGAVLFFSGWLGEKLLHREAMGMGDVKLLAACGLMTSLSRLPMLLILAFLTAACIAVPLLIRRIRRPEAGSDMAFGPFIALASLLVLLLSKLIFAGWDWYLGLMIGA